MEEEMVNVNIPEMENNTDSAAADINSEDSASDENQISVSKNLVEAADSDDKQEQPSNNTGEWEDILGSGAIMKKIVKEGKPDTKPKRQMICIVNYKCTLEDGTFVENMENHKIQLGDLEVIQGVDLILSLMNIGEKCIIRVEPRLAYGSKGNPPRVPPNVNVQYEVELLDADFEKEDLTIPERKLIGNNKKQRGNWWYGRGEYTFAIQCYRRALDYLDDVDGGITKPKTEADLEKEETTDSELQDLLEDRLSVHNNMAAAQMKQGATDAALQSLQNVLRCQPNNVKALYRKSMVLKEKNDIQEAIKCLQKAKSIEPDNTSILKEIKSVNGILQKQKNYEKELARRMFKNTKESDKIPKEKKTSPILWASIVGSVAIGIAGIVAWKLKFT